MAPGITAVLLRHCRWDAERLENEWFCDEQRVREAVGLAAEAGGAPTSVNDVPLTCTTCFDGFAPGEMLSAGCAHYYCRECWGGYVGGLRHGCGARRRVPGLVLPLDAGVVAGVLALALGAEERLHRLLRLRPPAVAPHRGPRRRPQPKRRQQGSSSSPRLRPLPGTAPVARRPCARRRGQAAAGATAAFFLLFNHLAGTVHEKNRCS